MPVCRLTLPHEVGGEDDDGSCKAVYDPADENGTITVTLKKASQASIQHRTVMAIMGRKAVCMHALFGS